MHRETGVLLWDEYTSKMAELIQIYSDETALCPGSSLHGPVCLAADGSSPKAIKLANIRGLFWVFSSSD